MRVCYIHTIPALHTRTASADTAPRKTSMLMINRNVMLVTAWLTCACFVFGRANAAATILVDPSKSTLQDAQQAVRSMLADGGDGLGGPLVVSLLPGLHHVGTVLADSAAAAAPSALF